MQWARDYLMASVHSAEEREQANAMGCRAFRISPNGIAVNLRPGETMCRSVNGVGCADCLLCCGMASPTAPNPVIEAHGTGARFVRCSA